MNADATDGPQFQTLHGICRRIDDTPGRVRRAIDQLDILPATVRDGVRLFDPESVEQIRHKLNPQATAGRHDRRAVLDRLRQRMEAIGK